MAAGVQRFNHVLGGEGMAFESSRRGALDPFEIRFGNDFIKTYGPRWGVLAQQLDRCETDVRRYFDPAFPLNAAATGRVEATAPETVAQPPAADRSAATEVASAFAARAVRRLGLPSLAVGRIFAALVLARGGAVPAAELSRRAWPGRTERPGANTVAARIADLRRMLAAAGHFDVVVQTRGEFGGWLIAADRAEALRDLVDDETTPLPEPPPGAAGNTSGRKTPVTAWQARAGERLGIRHSGVLRLLGLFMDRAGEAVDFDAVRAIGLVTIGRPWTHDTGKTCLSMLAAALARAGFAKALGTAGTGWTLNPADAAKIREMVG